MIETLILKLMYRTSSSGYSESTDASSLAMTQAPAQTEPLAHLKQSYSSGDSDLYKAACISYNNTVADVAAISCYFCEGPGHMTKDCPVRIDLSLRWQLDPLRMMAFSRFLKDFKDSKRSPLN